MVVELAVPNAMASVGGASGTNDVAAVVCVLAGTDSSCWYCGGCGSDGMEGRTEEEDDDDDVGCACGF